MRNFLVPVDIPSLHVHLDILNLITCNYSMINETRHSSFIKICLIILCISLVWILRWNAMQIMLFNYIWLKLRKIWQLSIWGYTQWIRSYILWTCLWISLHWDNRFIAWRNFIRLLIISILEIYIWDFIWLSDKYRFTSLLWWSFKCITSTNNLRVRLWKLYIEWYNWIISIPLISWM